MAKEELSGLSDEAVFAAARESLPVLRRFACYAAVGWLGIAVLPIALVSHGFARSPIFWFALVVGVLHLVALPGLRTAPAAWARVVGLLLAPVLWIATHRAGKTVDRTTLARHRDRLVEAGCRLGRDPEGAAQRRWLEG